MMLEGNELNNENSKLRFRSYQPVIRGLIHKGDMEGVMKLWKHMQWHNVLPKVWGEVAAGGLYLTFWLVFGPAGFCQMFDTRVYGYSSGQRGN